MEGGYSRLRNGSQDIARDMQSEVGSLKILPKQDTQSREQGQNYP